MQNLELRWSDGGRAVVDTVDNPASRYYLACIKHLQHVPLSFNARSNPLHRPDLEGTLQRIQQLSSLMGMPMDREQLARQQYLNHMHDTYVQEYGGGGDPRWLELHDLLHVLEDRQHGTRQTIWVDHREAAGPLCRPFDRAWLRHCAGDIQPGDCYLHAHDLGKTLWSYWRDGEPRDDMPRVFRLCRPWQVLRPVLTLSPATITQRYRARQDDPEFQQWLDRVAAPWAEHWALVDWQRSELGAAFMIGHMRDPDWVLSRFRQGNTPTHVTLCGD